MVFRRLTEWCSHHRYLISEYIIIPQRHLTTIRYHSPLFPPPSSLWQPPIHFLSLGFLYSYLYSWKGMWKWTMLSLGLPMFNLRLQRENKWFLINYSWKQPKFKKKLNQICYLNSLTKCNLKIMLPSYIIFYRKYSIGNYSKFDQL